MKKVTGLFSINAMFCEKNSKESLEKGELTSLGLAFFIYSNAKNIFVSLRFLMIEDSFFLFNLLLIVIRNGNSIIKYAVQCYDLKFAINTMVIRYPI